MIRTVHFLELDDQDDYLISFWLDPNGEHRLTVLRSLEYEPDLEPEERPKPVLFTHEAVQPAEDPLLAAEWDERRVRLKSRHREFEVDLSRIRHEEDLARARTILRRMNYDDSFELLLRRGPKKTKPASATKKKGR